MPTTKQRQAWEDFTAKMGESGFPIPAEQIDATRKAFFVATTFLDEVEIEVVMDSSGEFTIPHSDYADVSWDQQATRVC